MSRELYAAAHAVLGHRRGGLAMSTIVACGGFGAICGSSLATAATMAKVAYPEMRRIGYSEKLAAGSIAAGGTLGNCRRCPRSEEHTSELQSLMRNSYAVF